MRVLRTSDGATWLITDDGRAAVRLDDLTFRWLSDPPLVERVRREARDLPPRE